MSGFSRCARGVHRCVRAGRRGWHLISEICKRARNLQLRALFDVGDLVLARAEFAVARAGRRGRV